MPWFFWLLVEYFYLNHFYVLGFVFFQRVENIWWFAKIRRKLFKIANCFKSWDVVFLFACIFQCSAVTFWGLFLFLYRIVKGCSNTYNFILWDCFVKKERIVYPNSDIPVELSNAAKKNTAHYCILDAQDTSAMPLSRHTGDAHLWTKE